MCTRWSCCQHSSADSTGVHARFLEDIMMSIIVEKLPWHTSAEFTQKCLQHQDEEERVKDRALMYTNSNSKLLTVLTMTRTQLQTLECIPWMTCTANSSTLRLLIRPTIGPSLAHDQRLYQCQGRQSRAVCLKRCSSPAACKQ